MCGDNTTVTGVKNTRLISDRCCCRLCALWQFLMRNKMLISGVLSSVTSQKKKKRRSNEDVSPPRCNVWSGRSLLLLPVSVWLTIWTVRWAKSIILSTLNDRRSSSSRAMSPRKATETDKQKHAHVRRAEGNSTIWSISLSRAGCLKRFLTLRLSRMHGGPVKALVEGLERVTHTHTQYIYKIYTSFLSWLSVYPFRAVKQKQNCETTAHLFG